MSQLKVNAISDAAGANGNAITLATDGTCTAKITNRSNRNLIINGACLVSQRNTSSTTHGYTTVDRVTPYGTSHNAGQLTFSQSDITSGPAWDAGFRKAFKVASAQAGNTSSSACYIHGYQTKLEAQDIAGSGWDYTDPTSKVTLSFWIKASTADNFQLQVYADDGGKKKYNTVVAATTSWTKITKTIPGHADLQFDTNNGYGLGITLVIASGADLVGTVTQDTWVANSTAAISDTAVDTWLTAGAGTVEVTGFQLELGSTATDFEHRSYGDELARCQRYLFKLGGANQGTNVTIGAGFLDGGSGWSHWTHGGTFPVEMRVEPSLSLGGDANAAHINTTYTSLAKDASSVSLNGTGSRSFGLRIQGSSSSNHFDSKYSAYSRITNTATWILFSAEL